MPSVSLVIVDNLQHNLAKFSIDQTRQHIHADEVIVFSDRDFYSGSRFVPIRKNITVHDYSELILKHLWMYVETDFALVIQFDGMAVDGSQWTDEFFNYDYIGAPWPWFPPGQQVGNGGFSLRSMKLIQSLRDPMIKLGGVSGDLEDTAICREFRPYLESKYQIHYAPLELAKQFSMENITTDKSFGFHGIWNSARYFDRNQLAYIIEHMHDHIWRAPDKYRLFVDLLHQRGFDDLVGLVISKISTQ